MGLHKVFGIWEKIPGFESFHEAVSPDAARGPCRVQETPSTVHLDGVPSVVSSGGGCIQIFCPSVDDFALEPDCMCHCFVKLGIPAADCLSFDKDGFHSDVIGVITSGHLLVIGDVVRDPTENGTGLLHCRASRLHES